jgi:hypothetical protein
MLRFRSLVALTAVTACALAAAPQAAAAPATVMPTRPSPFTVSYHAWAAAWWTWALTLTHAQQTVITGTGAVDCSIGQNGQVWFIGWSRTNSAVDRSCSVPAGTALFLPVIAEAGTTGGAGNPITPQELRQATTHDIDDASHLFARVDGVRIRHLSRFRAVTPFFYTRMLRNDILDLPEGTLISAIGDGYWLMISPLDPGVHHLRVAGTIHGDTRDVRYTINVTAGQGAHRRMQPGAPRRLVW